MTVRIATSRTAAQNGLNRMSTIMDSKLLDINTDKLVHVIVGDNEKKQKMKEDIVKSPLIYKSTLIKEILLSGIIN